MGIHITYPFKLTQPSGDHSDSAGFFDMIIINDRARTKMLDNIIKERIIIARNLNISYLELDEVTYVERQTMIKEITEDMQKRNEAMRKAREGNS